jgi:hypothetical protein
MKRMKRLWILGVLLTATPVLQAAESGHLLAFAVDNRLTLAIGKFDPRHGWVSSTDYYSPPQPGDPFTLFTPDGKSGTVTIQENRSPVSDSLFANWTAQISKWNNRSNPYALAVGGLIPDGAEALESIPANDPEAIKTVSKYLAKHGLEVQVPILTQAYRIPLADADRKETILIAHSDAAALATEKEGAVYAVALLVWQDHGAEKILPLASQTSFKPLGRTRDEHEHLYGTRDFLRLVAAMDLDGDGWREIVLYDAKEDAIQMDVFSFNGHHLHHVLSAYKPNYN